MITICFVCHGNICRSIAAECIGNKIIKDKGLEDKFIFFSRATSREEIGNSIYPPMRRCLLESNIPIKPHFAEQITKRDYERADYIFYMDENNKRWLDYLFLDIDNKERIITCYEDDISHIEDPWYSDRYELVVSQLKQCVEHIIDRLSK